MYTTQSHPLDHWSE